jgi:hypothetical protein
MYDSRPLCAETLRSVYAHAMRPSYSSQLDLQVSAPLADPGSMRCMHGFEAGVWVIPNMREVITFESQITQSPGVLRVPKRVQTYLARSTAAWKVRCPEMSPRPTSSSHSYDGSSSYRPANMFHGHGYGQPIDEVAQLRARVAQLEERSPSLYLSRLT